MKTRLPFLGVLVALMSAAPLTKAEIITEPTRTFNVDLDIGDPQDPPQFFLQTISDSAILSLTRVEVGLNLVGTPADNGFASDMFVSLNLNLDQTSILLNRVGITDSDPVGLFYDGWDVTFSDDGAGGDIHFADTVDGLGILTGAFEPDGRVFATDMVRASLLSVFNGSTGNGDWRLAVGDLSETAQMHLVSWSLTLTGDNAVPEPSSIALLALGGLGLVAWKRRLSSNKA